MQLKRYIFRRFIEIAIIFFVILTGLFFLFHLAPGDPLNRSLDPSMTSEEEQHLVSQLGLDQPLWTQYVRFVSNFFTGRFGTSFHYGKPVADIIAERLPNTVLLFTSSVILSALIGILLGKSIAWRKGQRVDTVVTISALVCHTLFLPWVALLFIWGLGYKLGAFPLSGMMSPELGIDMQAGFVVKGLDVLHHMALPLFTLFLIQVGSYLLIMRSSMLDTLNEDYIFTARAKGLPEHLIRDRHAAPNAALPVVTSVGLSLAFSINGGVLTEKVFSWPGIGQELVFAVSNNDYPLSLACFLLIALVVLVANLVVDILYAYLDPRIRY